MGVLLSIVVPVFNVQHYLSDCIESLLKQDIAELGYEIILVDDGSSDESGKICDDYALRTPFISVIHQDNQGLSVARNTGLRFAQGTFIQFVDSDDWLVENSLLSLVKRMEEEKLDILRFNYNRVQEYEGKYLFTNEGIKGSDIQSGNLFLVNELGFFCYACQFVIRKDLLLDNCLFFKPGIIYEDTEWIPRVLSVAHRVASIDTIVYNYRLREGSITNSSAKRKVDAQLAIIDELKLQSESKDNTQWYLGMIAHTVVSLISTVSAHLYKERTFYIRRLKEKRVFPLSSYKSKKNTAKKICIINLSPGLACFLIHLLNK